MANQLIGYTASCCVKKITLPLIQSVLELVYYVEKWPHMVWPHLYYVRTKHNISSGHIRAMTPPPPELYVKLCKWYSV